MFREIGDLRTISGKVIGTSTDVGTEVTQFDSGLSVAPEFPRTLLSGANVLELSGIDPELIAWIPPVSAAQARIGAKAVHLRDAVVLRS